MRALMQPLPVGAAACALVLLLTGCGPSSGTAAAVSSQSGSPYTLLQMNLCLSGLAGCYRRVRYPEGLLEAIARIRGARPDAVTFNEACGGDAARIARRIGYHLRFSSVIYYGKPLPCIHPGGRGLFGDAVLTKAPIQGSDSQPFKTQVGPEQRQWLCVSTPVTVDVCTAHLASHETVEVAANAPQCAERRTILQRRAADGHTVIFGGDLNRHGSCAPQGFWRRTDSSARQDPGLQQVYGTGALRSPSARVAPATHTDHDVLIVRAFLAKQQ
jgi:endonuclease/exonuclease/phosphatase family metal-dependent hydrolase